MKRGALFLDRDGVINVPPPPGIRYILAPDAFYLMPGIAETIRLCNQHHIPVVVITNQKCVALGRLSLEGLSAIHQRMTVLLRAEQAQIDGVYFCPHAEEDACDCRKPLPGMLLQAAREHQIDLSRSWMVGDQPRDILAGRAAGCRTLHIGMKPSPDAESSLPDTRQLPKWLHMQIQENRACGTDATDFPKPKSLHFH